MTQKSSKDKNGSVKMGRTVERPYWVVIASIFIRAVHQVGAAVFLGAVLLGNKWEVPEIYIILVVLTGVFLLIAEGMRHRQMFRELSGMNTVIKLIILGAAWHLNIWTVPAILFAFIFASICSHAPRSIRHRLLY